MKARLECGNGFLAVDFSRGRSLAIELDPGGRHPCFFSDSTVKSEPLRLGGFIGDMSAGGSCNADVIQFSAHSHGTHTECIGHIRHDQESVTQTIDQQLTLLRLISIGPETLASGGLIPPEALDGIERFDGGALAVRTLPNEDTKQWRNYRQSPEFPVFSPQAMRLLGGSTLMHLLVDTPSLDRADSQGLENHATWWGLDPDTRAGVPEPARRSITEMIYVPDDIPDGDYLLELQLAPIVSDAVPSRPVIYPIERIEAGAA